MAFAVFRDVIDYMNKPSSNGFTAFEDITISASLPFGTDADPYRLAELLPEVLKPKNQYTQGAIEFISPLASAGSSYSPTEINKGGQRVGFFDVKFGFTNQKNVLDAATYETIADIMELSDDSSNRKPETLEAAAEQVIDWTYQQVTKPMLDLNELYRSQAICDARVNRVGANGYNEIVIYPDGEEQRADIPGGSEDAPAGWNTPDGSYDPLQDIIAVMQLARRKGLEIVGMYSDSDAKLKYMMNKAIIAHFMGISLAPGSDGQIQVNELPNIIDEDAIDALHRRYRLPPWTTYDKTYNELQDDNLFEQVRFMERTDENGATYHPIIFVCRTNRNLIIELPDPIGAINLTNTLGYYGIGRCVGHPRPGRHLNQLLEDALHPPSFTAELIQEGLPVLQAPERFFVRNIFDPIPA